MQDRYVEVDGIRTRYWDAGSGDEAVLLIHGIGRYVEDWLSFIDTLASSHRLVALDLPGYGLSGKPCSFPYTLDAFAGFVGAFLDTLHLDVVSVIGHSLGGAIATRFAIMFPERCHGLILVSSAGLGRGLSLLFKLASIPLVGELLTRPDPSKGEQTMRFIVHDIATITPEMSAFDHAMATQEGAPQAFLKTVRASVNILGQKPGAYGPNLRGLSGVGPRVGCIWGREDRIIPPSHADKVAETLPGAMIRVIDGCGHLPMREKPALFNEAVARMLDGKHGRG